MDKIISTFSVEYPRITRALENLNPQYPPEVKMRIGIHLSVTMQKLQQSIQDIELRDLFGEIYIKNYVILVTKVFTYTGGYTKFSKNMGALDPDTFVKEAVSKL